MASVTDTLHVSGIRCERCVMRLATALEGVADWSEKPLEEAVRHFAETEKVKLGQVAQPLRVALTGSTASPGIFEVVAILGPAETRKRLLAAGG